MSRWIAVGLLVLALALVTAPVAMAVGTAAGEEISNIAYGDYADANGNALPRVYSNEVTTEVSQVAGVDVTPTPRTKTGVQGTSVAYGVTVTNTGNGDDTFDLTTVNPDGWPVTIYLDDDGDGMWDVVDVNGDGIPDTGELTVVSDTGELGADEEFYVIVVVAIPALTPNDTESLTTLTATSRFDDGVTADGEYTTRCEDAVLTTTKSVDPATGNQPGDVVTFAIEGHNTGSADAQNVVVTDEMPANTTYVLGSIRVGPVGGTYATATPKTDADDGDEGGGQEFIYNSVTDTITAIWGTAQPEPDASGSGVIYFQVEIDAGVSAGTVITNTAAVNYDVAGAPQPETDSTPAHFKVDNLPAILLDPDRASNADPGDQVVYAFTVYNQGNDEDTIDLDYTSSAGWTWTFWADVDENGVPNTDGDYELEDTDGDGKIDTDDLDEGESLPVLTVATVPAGTADGTIDSTTVTGYSSVDPTVTDPENLTTTVTAPVLSLAKEVDPVGNQLPGTELTYTITVTNTGTGVATNIVITDAIPDYTTYVDESIETGSDLLSLVSRSDSNNGDGARYDAGSDAVIVPDGGTLSLGPNGELIIRFKVTID